MAKIFEKGDFVGWINVPGSFGIYEGKNLNTNGTYPKKMSLIMYYNPRKYMQVGDSYKEQPYMEVAENGNPCEKTIDTDKEDYWWHVLTPMQYENALNVLEKHGYRWDEESLALIKIDTGEIVKQIAAPKLEYNGEIVKPIRQDFKSKLTNFVKTQTKSTPYYYSGYGCCHFPSEVDDYWD